MESQWGEKGRLAVGKKENDLRQIGKMREKWRERWQPLVYKPNLKEDEQDNKGRRFEGEERKKFKTRSKDANE